MIRASQVKVYEGIQEFTEQDVIFNDGKQARFDAIILATGFRPSLNALLTDHYAQVYDQNGTPRSSGDETKMPGLCFCGYYVAPTGMLRGISMEAKRISRSIAGKTHKP